MDPPPSFNPNAPGVILLGQIILDYNNNANPPGGQQPGSAGNTNSKQSQQAGGAPSNEPLREGYSSAPSPPEYIASQNCGPPKVYFNGPYHYPGAPTVPQQMPTQFIFPPAFQTPAARFGTFMPSVPVYSNGSMGFPPQAGPQFAVISSPMELNQASSYPQPQGHPHAYSGTSARRPKTAPQGRPEPDGASRYAGTRTSASGTSLAGDYYHELEETTDSMFAVPRNVESTDEASSVVSASYTSTEPGHIVDEIGDTELTASEKAKILNPNAQEFYPTASSENLSIGAGDNLTNTSGNVTCDPPVV